jgi:hypothetical protein
MVKNESKENRNEFIKDKELKTNPYRIVEPVSIWKPMQERGQCECEHGCEEKNQCECPSHSHPHSH